MARRVLRALAPTLPACIAALVACTGSDTVTGTYGRAGSDFLRVLVARSNGHIDPTPAYRRADEYCGERLQSAVFFMAQDVGDDERLFYFRCE